MVKKSSKKFSSKFFSIFSTLYLVVLGQILNVTILRGEKFDIVKFAIFVHFEDGEFDVDQLVGVGRHEVPRALGAGRDAAGIVGGLNRRQVGHLLWKVWIHSSYYRGLATTGRLKFGYFLEGRLPTRSLDLVVCHKLFQLIYIFRLFLFTISKSALEVNFPETNTNL